MTPLKLLASSAVAAGLVSCAANQQTAQDTSNPYSTPTYDSAEGSPYQQVDAVNPVYDTPAAYEESTSSYTTNPPAAAGQPYVPSAAGNTPRSSGPTTIHTVVKGDTLWDLSRKYNVSIEAIKRANSMTRDIVVLDQKLVIPAP